MTAVRLTKAGAYLLLAAYVLLTAASYFSLEQPESTGLSIGPCGDALCVAWVMPAGLAWESGVRPGMRVIALDGQPLADEIADVPPGAASPEQIAVRSASGQEIRVMPRKSSLVGGLPSLRCGAWARCSCCWA